MGCLNESERLSDKIQRQANVPIIFSGTLSRVKAKLNPPVIEAEKYKAKKYRGKSLVNLLIKFAGITKRGYLIYSLHDLKYLL